jgi:hypothetical protein
MVVFGRVEVVIHPFLKSALYGGQRSASRSGHFTQTKQLPLLTKPEARGGGGKDTVWTSWLKVKVVPVHVLRAEGD